MNKQLTIVLAAGLMLFCQTGCNRNKSVDIRKARILANENLQIQEQIEAKEQQIASLEEKLKQIESNHKTAMQEGKKAEAGVLEMLSNAKKQHEQLTIENKKLKEALANLN